MCATWPPHIPHEKWEDKTLDEPHSATGTEADECLKEGIVRSESVRKDSGDEYEQSPGFYFSSGGHTLSAAVISGGLVLTCLAQTFGS